MLYDKVGNCMNENEMNKQENLNNGIINPSVGVPPVGTNNMEVPSMVPNNVIPQQTVTNNLNVGVASNLTSENVGVNTSIPTPPSNNFMEDFSQAVVPEPVTPTVNVSTMSAESVVPPVTTSMPENTSVPGSQQITQNPTVEAPIISETPQSQAMPHLTTEISNPSELQQQTTPTENISETQPEIEETSRKKKKGNWAFIIALFAVVGFFVLLLPLLVRIFGY